MTIRPEFDTHTLNDRGVERVKIVAQIFSDALESLELVVPAGRDRALMITKLQEAKMVAVRGTASDPANQG